LHASIFVYILSTYQLDSNPINSKQERSMKHSSETRAKELKAFTVASRNLLAAHLLVVGVGLSIALQMQSVVMGA
jgi:hypothetical protein